jgi:hypothetical protein
MAIMAKITSKQQYAEDTALIAGFKKHLPSGTFTIRSQSQTTAQVVAVLQARADKALAADTAKTAAHAAVLDERQEYASTHDYVQDVRLTVLAMFSKSPQVLGDFGVSPRKQPVPLSPAKKLIAATKRAATRAARGIVGKKKRAAVTGAVTGTIQVPVDGSATTLSPTPPAAPPPATPPAIPATTNGTSTPHS